MALYFKKISIELHMLQFHKFPINNMIFAAISEILTWENTIYFFLYIQTFIWQQFTILIFTPKIPTDLFKKVPQ